MLKSGIFLLISLASLFVCNYGQENHPKDCAEVLMMGSSTSGVYDIWPVHRLIENLPIRVYCDMETDGGGWTVIQRRGDFGKPKDYFYKCWTCYKEGFGNIEEDFWLGNDKIHALTNQKVYSARFDLRDFSQNKRYALYEKFWIDDEHDKYALHLSDYSGDAGDSMMSMHNNRKFTTKDQRNDNNDSENCAELYKGAWWYNSYGCHRANLNGLYHQGYHESYADGVNWNTWKGFHESLQFTEIKIRPKGFKPPCD